MTPGSPTNIARDSKFSALLNYPYNEPFDLQEQQSSGQMKVRTFRVLYTQFVIRDSITAATPMNQPIPNNNVVTAPKQVTGTVQPAGNYQQVPGSRIRQGIAVNGTSQQLPNQNRTVSTRPILNTSVATTTLALQNINWNIELVPKGYDVLGAKTFILAGLDHAAVNQYNQNALKPNRSYKFEITGVLEELVGNTWTAVKRPGTNIPITQTKKNYFKTNSATVSLYAPVSSPAGQSPTRITPPTNQR